MTTIKHYVVLENAPFYIKWTCGSCTYMGITTFTDCSGLSESSCCFVIHYTDVSKYSAGWNYHDEANGLHFLRSVDFAL